MDSMENFRERLDVFEAHMHAVEQRLRWWRGIACGLLIVGLISLPLPAGMAKEKPPDKDNKGLPQRVQQLEAQVKALQDTLAAVTFDATANEVVITGANLRIVNGLGSTETTNGLGNLIVGYNESRQEFESCLPIPEETFCQDRHTGSHNVVVGQFHNFSSFVGLVVGVLNEISGGFASVSGGEGNTASGFTASVSGGIFNTASGDGASVSGGEQNTANAGASSVSGGIFNTTSGAVSSVSGGESNTASGNFSSVSGGSNRSAPGTENWAAGSLLEPN